MARTWSKIITKGPDGKETGVQVRIFTRERGGTLYRSVITGTRINEAGQVVSAKDIKSLKTRDKEVAEENAKALCKALDRERAIEKVNGPSDSPLTFGQLRTLYLRHKTMKPYRAHFVRRTLELFGRLLEPNGLPFKMENFAGAQVERYIEERRAGCLKSNDPRSRDTVRNGTIAIELQVLRAVCNWAVEDYKLNGKPLLAHNPVPTKKFPREDNQLRPIATRDRFDRLVAVASKVDPSGQFRLMLQLAFHTGRRINAICHLRRSDVMFGVDQVRRGMGVFGWDESWADAWPDAIVWRAEWDKKGFTTISPVTATLRVEIDAYLRSTPVLGEAWLFPSLRRPGVPTLKAAADWWFCRGEEVAELQHQARGRWHTFRRAWATTRKAHPLADVMAAGGWRDAKALQKVYQAADPRTVARVMEGA